MTAKPAVRISRLLSPEHKPLPEFDFKNPSYVEFLNWRLQLVNLLLEQPKLIPEHMEECAADPNIFVFHHCWTYDPRAVAKGRPALIPMYPFPRQVEFMDWIEERWQKQQNGVVLKSRDYGATWTIIYWGLCKWLFVPGVTIGYGSRIKDYVDQSKSQKSIFQRLLDNLHKTPRFLWPEDLVWNKGKAAPNNYAKARLASTINDAYITGESGDNVGRGDRTSAYFNDEYAIYERPEKVDASLSNNTDCQIDISTPSSAGHKFYHKCEQYRETEQFIELDWHDDPRKSQEWYDDFCENHSPEIVAQEVDRNPLAAQGDSIIDSKHLESCIDAHKILGFEPMGTRVLAYDPAHSRDKQAIVFRQGNVILEAEHIPSKGANVGQDWAYEKAKEMMAEIFIYDAGGLGDPTMSFWMQYNNPTMEIQPFYNDGAVMDPGKKFGTDDGSEILKHVAASSGLKTNHEEIMNLRGQVYLRLAERMRKTHITVQRVRKGLAPTFHVLQLISISSQCKNLTQLKAELCIPQRKWQGGKRGVESKADMRKRGVSSPNLADAASQTEAAKHAALERKKVRDERRRQVYAHLYNNPDYYQEHFQISDPEAGY